MYEVDTKELKHIMIDADVATITELADKTGVNRNTLSGILNGSEYPSSMVMHKIMSALGLAPEQAGKIFFAEKLASDASFEESL